jgi:hypothetical protein
MVKRRWSFRFLPTLGRPLVTGVESLDSSTFRSIPERSSLEESMEAADRLISFATLNFSLRKFQH